MKKVSGEEGNWCLLILQCNTILWLNRIDWNMTDSKIVVCVLLNHYFKRLLNATAAACTICSVKGETVEDSTARKCCWKFKFRDTDVEDKYRLGCPLHHSQSTIFHHLTP